MIAEAVLAIEYGASSEDIARTTHAHVSDFDGFTPIAASLHCTHRFIADTKRSIQRGSYGGVLEVDPLLDSYWIFLE